MITSQLETPIVFIIFNRPDTTQVVFNEIKKARPKKLFVIADGPRPHKLAEDELCYRTRTIVDQIDWPCELFTHFAEQNMGCKERVSSGLDWVFEQVETAIILEDDCLPNATFFEYAQELLDLYKEDTRIMGIAGSKALPDDIGTADSYYFSRYAYIWGWATWKRSWKLFDKQMKSWPAIRDRGELLSILKDMEMVKYWNRMFEETYQGKIDSWAYPWLLSCWVQSGLFIIPRVNLISNVGYGAEATHTTEVDHLANIPSMDISLPLVHPQYIIQNQKLDHLLDYYQYNVKTEQHIFNEQKNIYYKEKWLHQLLIEQKGITACLKNKSIQNVCIFGTGIIGQYILQDCLLEKLNVIAFIDNQWNKKRLNKFSVPVYAEDWMFDADPKVEAIIVSIEGNHDIEIIAKLKEKFAEQNIAVFSWKDLFFSL